MQLLEMNHDASDDAVAFCLASEAAFPGLNELGAGEHAGQAEG